MLTIGVENARWLAHVRLVELRKLLGLRQADVAAWLGLHREAVCKLEKERQQLTVGQLLILIDRTGANPLWLLGLSEQNGIDAPTPATARPAPTTERAAPPPRKRKGPNRD